MNMKLLRMVSFALLLLAVLWTREAPARADEADRCGQYWINWTLNSFESCGDRCGSLTNQIACTEACAKGCLQGACYGNLEYCEENTETQVDCRQRCQCYTVSLCAEY